jgi:hypothetical protein
MSPGRCTAACAALAQDAFIAAVNRPEAVTAPRM